MIEKKITIFTPTYNRAEKLKGLYSSLKKQTCKSFVWIIVDDGSTDNTKELIDKYIAEAEFEIQYYFQENSGKSMAHNLGVKLTKTELFTCVDSDDYLTENAIERILDVWDKKLERDIGILAKRRVTKKKKEIFGVIHTTLRDSQKQWGITGDTMLIYKSSSIKKYSFPYYENEKFVPENYIYDLLDRDGTLIFLDEVLYCGDYLDDGYTKNMVNVIKNNPNGYISYIIQRIQFDRSFFNIIGDLIRYIAIARFAKKKDILKESGYPLLCALLYPVGYLFYFLRYRN